MWLSFSRFAFVFWYFLPFCDCDLCVSVIFCHFFLWLQVFVYMYVQVCCSVVCNLSLCDLYVDVLLIDLFRLLDFRL